MKNSALFGLEILLMMSIVISQNALCGSKMEIILAVDWYIKHGNKSRIAKRTVVKEKNFGSGTGRNGGCDGDV